MSKKKAVHIFIVGKVQGVSYRWWFQKEANKMNLSGWVRNRTSNRVEAELFGYENDIEEMIKKCKLGPPSANVEDIIVNQLNDSKNIEENDDGIKILESI